MTTHDLQTWSGPEVRFGPFRLYPEQRVLLRADTPLRLGSRALEILLALVERAGEVVTKKELIARVWPDTIVGVGTLRVHIVAIRKALGDGQAGMRYVENVTGHGYRFIAPVTRVDETRPVPVVQAFAAEHPHSVPIQLPRRDSVRDIANIPGREYAFVASVISTRDAAGRALDVPSNAQSGRSERILPLPARLARMVGRDEAVACVSAQLLSDRFVTIVGPGGMGKTTVAISVAHAVSREFSSEIVFFDLASVTDSSLVASTLASLLGLAVPNNDSLTGVLAFLRARRILLVLDNCEHVIEVIAPLAGRIFSVAPQAYILATSREALRVEGEHVYTLPPLGTPADDIALSAAEALTYPAVQLFMERAAAGGSRFQLTDADAPVVAAMCRKLDGIALAVELAASRVSALGIRGTAELLDLRLKFLWQAQRTVPLRHQTLEALLDWSYNLLTEAEQSVLRRLSIFVGPFTLEAAQAIVSESEECAAEIVAIVANLVDKSLVSATTHASPAQYRLLETTRAYAAAKLAQDGETDAIANRHARYFVSLFRSEERRPLPSAHAQYLGNVRAALEWSFSAGGDSELGTDLILAVTPVLRLSWLAECRRWSERAIAALHEDARGTARELDLLESLAISTMFTRGNDDEVRTAIQRGLNLARKLGTKLREMDLLAGLNIFVTRIGDFQGALQVANDSAALAQTAADRSRTAVADWMLGVAHHLIGDQALAQKHCEAGFLHDTAPRRLHRDVFGYDHRVRALVTLARTLWLRGFAQRAARVAREAIDEAAMLNHPVTVCISLIYTAPVFLWSGDLTAADRVISQLIEQARQHSLNPYHAVGRGLLGELMLARGEREAGIELLRDALETLHAEQHFIQAPEFATHLAEGLAAQGQRDRGLASIEPAIAQRARSGASFDMPEILRVKGHILLSSSEADRALGHEHLTRSLELAQAQSSLSWALRTAMARLQATPANPQARETLAQIYERFTEGFDTPDLQAAQRLLGASR